jgi:hypothetical protein
MAETMERALFIFIGEVVVFVSGTYYLTTLINPLT